MGFKQKRENIRLRNRKALDEKTAVEAILPPFRRRFGQTAEIKSVKIDHLQKAVFVCKFHISKPEGEPVVWKLVAKACIDESRCSKSFKSMRALWDNGFSRDAADGIFIPEPVYLSEEAGYLFMEMIPGVRVRELLKYGKEGAAHMRIFARTLVKLHNCPIKPENRMTASDYLRRVEQPSQNLLAARPDLRKGIEYILKTAEAATPKFDKANLAAVHGDYHLGQVHIQGSRAWMVDIGGLKYGDPALDVSKVLALLEGEDAKFPNKEILIETFKDEYFAAADKSIALRTPFFQALTLLRRSAKASAESRRNDEKVNSALLRATACIRKLSS